MTKRDKLFMMAQKVLTYDVNQPVVQASYMCELTLYAHDPLSDWPCLS